MILFEGSLPNDYHCECSYCRDYKGRILNNDASVINCRQRVGYHWLGEKAHIAKTPFPIAAWAVEHFTRERDLVIDPTCGIGTTLVEAKKQGRQALGIELKYEWARFAAINCQLHSGKHKVINDDVRNWHKVIPPDTEAKLIVNNPPYSGDENVSIKTEGGEVVDRDWHGYDNDDRNLAFMKEGKAYYELLGKIYNGLAQNLSQGGFLVVGVKDMVHQKQPYMLHKLIAKEVDNDIYKYWGMTLLPHWPRTLFMNTYPKRFPHVKIPLYQTVLCWRKK